MAPWARRLLLCAMLGWTLLTAAAGWYAFRGTSPTASANRDGAAASPAGPPPGEAQPIDHNDVLAAASGPAPVPEASRQPPRLADTTVDTREPAGPYDVAHPAPSHATDGGAGVSVRSLDVDGPRGRPEAAPSRKGVVVLDPGHGRGDPGAVHYLPDGSGRWDITEADSNLRNAELIRDALVRMGYDVYLTREGEGQGPGRPLPLQWITSDLYARVALARSVDADLYLAIHGNGATVKSISGPETWYCGKHEEGAANERLATMVQQAMMDALHEYGYAPPDRGIKEDAAAHHSGGFCQFVVTRESPVPAALLEFLFLSNDDDARVLVDDRSHVLMAQHVARALDAFMRERRGEPPAPVEMPAATSTPSPEEP
jgi:N-acetylmuramoyl-L-alanine amidase